MESIRYSPRRFAEVLGLSPQELAEAESRGTLARSRGEAPAQKALYTVDDLASARAVLDLPDAVQTRLQRDGQCFVHDARLVALDEEHLVATTRDLLAHFRIGGATEHRGARDQGPGAGQAGSAVFVPETRP